MYGETLERKVILKQKARITRIVINENLSKMVLKFNPHRFPEKPIQQNEAQHTNDENLEKQNEKL